MRTIDHAAWEDILSRGSLSICEEDFTLDIRRGLPSLTILRTPDRVSLRVVEDLREWGWLPRHRVTLHVHPCWRRLNPSEQTIASRVQSALLRAENAR